MTVDTHRLVARLLVALVLALPVLLPAPIRAGEATPAGDASGAGASTEHHLAWDGADRLFRLYIPATLPQDVPVPLVVMMHGGFGNAEQAERAYGWDALADRQGFVVAYPEGAGKAWNAGSCCGRSSATDVDDVGFIEAMVGEIEASRPIDASRVYATGMSNGAMMAYRLPCESTTFAAVAPVAGTMMVECSGASPVSILHIHGLADTNVPFAGGRGNGFAHVDGPTVPDVIAFWRQVDACDAPVETVDGAMTTSTATCPHGRAVELIAIEGAGHQWPTSNPSAARVSRRGKDAPYDGLDATQAIWDFFVAHPMDPAAS